MERGLIGRAETSRLWHRHLLNCAVVETLLPSSSLVCDLGSGAGLPGIVLAIARPDLRVVLLEPMLRRVTFLQECVAELGLAHVDVVRGRAEEQAGLLRVNVVVARAVAPLDRLAAWALPLLDAAGQLLAIKGESASEEVATAAPTLRRLGATSVTIRRVGSGIVDPATTVVCVTGR
jgi:16S rRNA (guanine527-N7)-methyltransferase